MKPAFLLGLCLWSVFGLCRAAPNFLVILVDDLGYGDLSVLGGKDVRTPHIDGLFKRGLCCEQFYANCTVCSPTRASLLSGCYPAMAGVPGVVRQWPEDSWGYLQPQGPTLPEILKQKNYTTALIGKWHLGFSGKNIPNNRGFDFFHGFLGDMMDDYWHHRRGEENWMRKDLEIIDPEGHATDLFSRWAAEYIHKQSESEKPWFLYLAYNAPHFPIQPPPDWLENARGREPRASEKRLKNIAFVEHLDSGVGLVLDALKESGQEGETLVIFSSDNGGSLPHGASNGALRGGKQDHWEGGIRVATCVSWPGRIKPGTNRSLGMTMDIYPTLCEAASVGVNHAVDGISLLEDWTSDSSARSQPRTVFWHRREGGRRYGGQDYYAVRRGPWKLLQNHPFEPFQLFNLESDPGEKTPVDNRRVHRELSRALRDHVRETGRISWQPPLR